MLDSMPRLVTRLLSAWVGPIHHSGVMVLYKRLQLLTWWVRENLNRSQQLAAIALRLSPQWTQFLSPRWTLLVSMNSAPVDR